jgi:hypothetical protein
MGIGRFLFHGVRTAEQLNSFADETREFLYPASGLFEVHRDSKIQRG